MAFRPLLRSAARGPLPAPCRARVAVGDLLWDSQVWERLIGDGVSEGISRGFARCDAVMLHVRTQYSCLGSSRVQRSVTAPRAAVEHATRRNYECGSAAGARPRGLVSSRALSDYDGFRRHYFVSYPVTGYILNYNVLTPQIYVLSATQ